VNRYPRIARYFVNESSTLDRFPDGSVDFIYSDIVSQHLEPRAALVYIAEFMRLLTPRGVTVFRLPSHRRLGSDEIARPAAMAASAYRAGLTVVNGIPPTIGAGVSRVVMIDVQNRSDSTWDQTAVGAIRLGNHWRNERSDMIVQDDGRASLPTVVPPGTTERLSLTIRAPRDGGRFDCELDLVHEGISWFGDMGSTIVRLPVQITSDTSAAETAPR
jgi:hypothetical protein